MTTKLAETPALRSILLIDDNDDDNFIHRRQIIKSGLLPDEESIMVVTDPLSALELFEDTADSRKRFGNRFPPELVLLDINMPKMNGFEFLERYESLRTEQELRETILLMLTSSNSPRDFEQANRFPSLNGFVSKPITRESLRRIMSEYFPVRE